MSYPFPPRTALLGIIGAIIGEERNSYWIEESSLGRTKIGLQIIKPIQRSVIKTNYLQSRYPMTIDGVKILLPKDPFGIESKDQRGFNIPISLNVLRNVGYRIYFSSEEELLIENLKQRLKLHKYVYPPYLGHANMLATIEFMGEYEGNPCPKGNYEVATIFPTSILDLSAFKLENYGFTILFQVPIKLNYDISNNNLYLDKTNDLVFPTQVNQKIKASFIENTVIQVEGEPALDCNYITFNEGLQ